MSSLLTRSGRWLGGKLALYVVILFFLILASMIKHGANRDRELQAETNLLGQQLRELKAVADDASNAAKRRAPLIGQSADQIANVEQSLKNELLPLTSERDRIADDNPLVRRLPGTDSWQQIAKLNVQIHVLEELLAYSQEVAQWTKWHSEPGRRQADLAETQRRLTITRSEKRRIEEEITRQRKRLESHFNRYPRESRIPGLWAYRHRENIKEVIEARKNALREVDQRIAELERDYADAQTHPTPSGFDLNESGIEDILLPIQELITSKQWQLDSSTFGWISRAVENFWKPALLICVSAVLVPSWWTVIAYYFVAPLASRRFHVKLLEPSKLESENSAPESNLASLTSEASLQLALNEREHLLVRPEFLQGTPMVSDKRTLWLYDWRRPIMSLASNLRAMTRISAAGSESIDLHCGTDVSARLAVLPLFAGCPMVMRPRSVIGVVEQSDNPIRVTTVWRFFSLSGWLTFQLRYVLFHGPGSLIIQGCNGVRVGRADSGRAVNQASTLGFSGLLSYSVTRCETFGAYFTGAQQLFNDRFDGQGIYIYEVTPRHHGGGLSRGGVQNLIDVALRAFGI